jgi:hypothetical protein
MGPDPAPKAFIGIENIRGHSRGANGDAGAARRGQTTCQSAAPRTQAHTFAPPSDSTGPHQ